MFTFSVIFSPALNEKSSDGPTSSTAAFESVLL